MRSASATTLWRVAPSIRRRCRHVVGDAVAAATTPLTISRRSRTGALPPSCNWISRRSRTDASLWYQGSRSPAVRCLPSLALKRAEKGSTRTLPIQQMRRHGARERRTVLRSRTRGRTRFAGSLVSQATGTSECADGRRHHGRDRLLGRTSFRMDVDEQGPLRMRRYKTAAGCRMALTQIERRTRSNVLGRGEGQDPNNGALPRGAAPARAALSGEHGRHAHNRQLAYRRFFTSVPHVSSDAQIARRAFSDVGDANRAGSAHAR